MISVLVVVFTVQVLINIISTVGAPFVNDVAWRIYTLLPTPQKAKEKENNKLRNEVVILQREMIGTSAQDNFAKWARLRREHDRAKEKYEKAAQEQQSFRSSFDSIVSKLRWLGTQGVNFLCNTWYSKQPMFWLPHGWVPHQVEWVLSFPKAPLGSISVNVWAIACGSVIAMLTQSLVALWAMRVGDVKSSPQKGMKGRKPVAAGEKKEL